MLTFRDFLTSLRKLNLGEVPVIAHASLSAFGEVQGGADTVVGALLATFNQIIMPTFTYKTMVTPRVGPPNNGITYGLSTEANQVAAFYHPEMPVDPLMGVIPETLRQLPESKRSSHPIYSFAGVNADHALGAQTLADPFGPIQTLTENGGYVLLLGVDHTTNTSIHYAEQVAGCKQFIRWSLTPQGIIACPRWPGCSYGFNQVSPIVKSITKAIKLGEADVQAIPLKELVEIVGQTLAEDPFALLCNDKSCERCRTIRSQQAAD